MQTRIDSDAEISVPPSSPCTTASAPTFATLSVIALPLAWLAPITMAARFSGGPQWNRSAITPSPASHRLSACRMLGRVRIIQYLCPQDKPEVMAARNDVSSQVPGGIVAAFLFRAEGVSGEETHQQISADVPQERMEA
jgi:hypothetical protein